jgi:adenylate cyclase
MTFSIFFQTDNKTIETPSQGTILAASLKADINHMHVCGGNARCSTCRVDVTEGLENCLPRNEKETLLGDKLRFPPNIRLACQTTICGDISIRRPVVDEVDVKIISKQVGDKSGTKLGQEKDLAILFTDIVNYTQFAEAFPAYDVVHVLNRYYHAMNEIVEAQNGVISDVAGDGILALFGVMEDTENAAWDAVQAVRKMNAALTSFNEYLNQMYDWSFGIRAGINFGKVIVGNFDTGMMKKVAAIGDAVNMASRIETANKEFDTKLLVSESAHEQIRSLVEPGATHRTQLKGKAGDHLLFEVEL